MAKIDPNELCSCESGLLFKDCHKNQYVIRKPFNGGWAYYQFNGHTCDIKNAYKFNKRALAVKLKNLDNYNGFWEAVPYVELEHDPEDVAFDRPSSKQRQERIDNIYGVMFEYADNEKDIPYWLVIYLRGLLNEERDDDMVDE